MFTTNMKETKLYDTINKVILYDCLMSFKLNNQVVSQELRVSYVDETLLSHFEEKVTCTELSIAAPPQTRCAVNMCNVPWIFIEHFSHSGNLFRGLVVSKHFFYFTYVSTF